MTDAKTSGNYLPSRKKWATILKAVERAAATAKASGPDGRAALTAKDLGDLAHALSLALEGRPIPAWEEGHHDDHRPRELYEFTPKVMAVSYVLAVRSRVVPDRAPNKTAREALQALGVTGLYAPVLSGQAIRDWVNEEKALPGLATVRAEIARKIVEKYGRPPPFEWFFPGLTRE